MSCKCQGCGYSYSVDVLVDNGVWEKIKPEGKAAGAGLLCPTCIISEVSKLEGFSYLKLELKE